MIAHCAPHSSDRPAMLDRLQRQGVIGEIGMDQWSATVMLLLEEAYDQGGHPVLSDWLGQREVYLTLMQKFPERAAPQMFGPSSPCAPWLYDFYPTVLDGQMILGEDVGFCRFWRSIGRRIWLDPTIRLTHHGMHEFTADPMTAFVGPAPRVGEAAPRAADS